MATNDSNFMQEFNAFQTAFYTDVRRLNLYTRFDFQRHGYTLLYNMSKGLPALANIILNLKGINWTGMTSPAIFRALQRIKFCNGYSKNRVPSFVYYKQDKNSNPKKAKVTKYGLEFSDDIKTTIMGILFIDNKSYEYLKFTDKIQNLGKNMLAEFTISNNVIPAKRKARKKKV